MFISFLYFEDMDSSQEAISELYREMDELRLGIISAAKEHGHYEYVHPSHRQSAENLIHYVSLRHRDLREIQTRLADLGLSSLGRSEPHVLATVSAVCMALSNMLGKSPDIDFNSLMGFQQGRAILDVNTKTLLGLPANPARETRIMVTLPSEAAEDYKIVDRIIKANAEILRINCAHDNSESWAQMVHNIRKASKKYGREVKIAMDLAGPKLRTGKYAKGKAEKIKVAIGDQVFLVPDSEKVTAGELPIRIPCTLFQVFEDTAVGHRIFFDDGKVGGVVTKVSKKSLAITITETELNGSKIGSEKGINLPDTDLNLSALTEIDLVNLPFIVENADIVDISFVRSESDVIQLIEELKKIGGESLGIILKIETVPAFKHLPEILFAALRWPKVGVMIARGDLAVEAGYLRLAELQEEILWLCEAAHVPVVWATQVLDTLAKTGHPSRAEVTDAAMSSRAECVMLNKGPYVVEAVKFLDDVLCRMDDFQHKKQSLLRELHSWR